MRVTPEDFGGRHEEVPFREVNGGKIYRFLLSVTVAVIVGFAFSYLLDEKIGALLFVQALLAGVGAVTRESHLPREPYIIGDSNEIVYLTKEELKKKLEG